ncbi:MAG: DUF2075 domain-containing protein, partial [Bacteroidales bacterium]|nr:DUF2075 domain-containing protein [Bacteroidales bacterium]MBR0300623.1 DUF2075 domain-containing protein [Bacteroidales bacterium]
MIVYNANKELFVQDVKTGVIATKILNLIREKGLNAGQEREFASWHNSMKFMRDIVDDPEIDDDVQIAIEYNIPQTSKRVDFIIIGSNASNNESIVIVELKQWSRAEVVDDDMHFSVRTYVANDKRIVCHPSYQAYSYSRFLANYSQAIHEKHIHLIPCAYLHNYLPAYKSALAAGIYKDWYTSAPFFIMDEVQQFNAFIKKFITKKSSQGDLLYLIENGRIKPTKSLQDALATMVRGTPVFDLLDEQAVCFDMCIRTMLQCLKDKKKRTILVQGGPGTGKSVLAVNLLLHFITCSCNAAYVTKNSAPRQAFLSILSKNKAENIAEISQLFRSPFGLSQVPRNSYDCLIVDEAHRLVNKMYGDWNGENQVKECINASLLTVFMLDEDQAVTTKDIGSVQEISRWCKNLGSTIIMREETKLTSQFRCNGSDSYLQFIDNLLQRGKETVSVSLSELNYDFRIFDDASQMRDVLREKNAGNNKARMVAGYCYDWNVKHYRGDIDIELPGGFQAKWNLENDKIWAINPNSFEEVGCIHTAQGLEFDYVGVLIGKDLRFDEQSGRVITDKSAISKDDKSSGIRSASNEEAHRLILNTYKTLLTRGQKGCFVYCEDEALKNYFKRMIRSAHDLQDA